MTPLPNIILIMTDDQGWGDVAYNGNTTVQTPNLDAMAAEFHASGSIHPIRQSWRGMICEHCIPI